MLQNKHPYKWRIGKIYFNSVAVIGGSLLTCHAKNIDHFHKGSKDILSDITKLGANVSGGDTMFHDGIKIYDLGKRYHE